MELGDDRQKAWMDMTEEVHKLVLQEMLEEIKDDTEQIKAKLELLKDDPNAAESDIQAYETYLSAQLDLIQRIEQSEDDFDKEVERMKE